MYGWALSIVGGALLHINKPCITNATAALALATAEAVAVADAGDGDDGSGGSDAFCSTDRLRGLVVASVVVELMFVVLVRFVLLGDNDDDDHGNGLCSAAVDCSCSTEKSNSVPLPGRGGREKHCFSTKSSDFSFFLCFELRN